MSKHEPLNIAVQHMANEQKFVIIAQGVEAKLEYHLTDNQVNFHHTFVPTTLRGQGIAEKLVRTGLAWANAEGLTISASCSYVEKFLR